jgi:hypothetical protein
VHRQAGAELEAVRPDHAQLLHLVGCNCDAASTVHVLTL